MDAIQPDLGECVAVFVEEGEPPPPAGADASSERLMAAALVGAKDLRSPNFTRAEDAAVLSVLSP